MVDQIEVQPSGPIHGRIRPPGSKSITNRALICAALARGSSRLTGALDSEDTRVMVDSLRKLGIDIAVDLERAEIHLRGCNGQIAADRADLYIANSGTTVRFLTAMIAAAGRGEYRLDGTERMRQRPIGDLLAALKQLGAEAESETGNGCPPVVLRAAGLQGGVARVGGAISSQFLSALMMAAPYSEQDVELLVEGPLVSQPYVRMTAGVMAAFGVPVDDGDLHRLRIPVARYRARTYAIEPDASAASYFWGAAAVTRGEVTVEGLCREALQGDVAFCEVLEQMGCEVRYEENAISVRGADLRGVDVDMNAISDTVQTLAAGALFAQGPTTVRGVAHIRHKETDRIGDLARELRKLGARVDETSDGLTITPGPLRGASIETYKDHRMAMSLALVGLRQPGVVIRDPACTEKTYPRFFEDLAELCGKSTTAEQGGR